MGENGTMTEEWREPSSLTEAQDRRQAVILKVQEIQAQLGAEGEGLDSDWRRRAKYALAKTHGEARRLKLWIHNFQQEQEASGAMPLTPTTMARKLKQATDRLMSVYNAARSFVYEDTDERFDALEEAVREAEKTIGVEDEEATDE